jgi:hypothetical protein
MRVESLLVSSVNSLGGANPDTFTPEIHKNEARYIISRITELLPLFGKVEYSDWGFPIYPPEKMAIGNYEVEHTNSFIPGTELINLRPNLDGDNPFVRIRYRTKDNTMLMITHIGSKTHTGRLLIPPRRDRQVLWAPPLSV